MKEKVKIWPLKILDQMVVHCNEKRACKYSDISLAVNERDKNGLLRLYSAKDIRIMPVSLIDYVKDLPLGLTAVPPTFIFLGNNWYANIHGLTWFIRNVLDHVNIRLKITGARMDQIVDKFVHPKVEFLGFVDDLTPELLDADYILSPIFIGSGMKVKTCQALMFGKNIIGTKESFEGYHVNPDKIGAICETAEDFIHAINTICSEPRNKFNKNSRQYYLDNYSFDATVSKFSELLNS